MRDWKDLFASYRNSSVISAGIAADEAEIQAVATASGLDFVHVDVHDVSDKRGLLQSIAGALEFPEYFGVNWDALNDCLTDMSWRPAAGYVVLLTGLQRAGESLSEDVVRLTEVLQGVVDFWRERERPFYVILNV